MNYPFTIAYNLKEGKVGCVLMQSLFGTTFSGGMVTQHFEPDDWDLSPTDLAIYQVSNDKTWEALLEHTKQKHDERAAGTTGLSEVLV